MKHIVLNLSQGKGREKKDLSSSIGVWLLASSSAGDAATGAEVRQLSGYARDVWSVAYSPDGSQIVSGSEDWTVRVWDATIKWLLARPKQLLQRDPPLFRPDELERFGFEGRGRAH